MVSIEPLLSVGHAIVYYGVWELSHTVYCEIHTFSAVIAHTLQPLSMLLQQKLITKTNRRALHIRTKHIMEN